MAKKRKSKEPSRTIVRGIYDYKDGDLYWKHDHPTKPYGGRGGKQRTVPLKGKLAGTTQRNTGLRQVKHDGDQFYIRRLIWIYHNGKIPDNMVMSHIDGDNTNNHIENLQLLSFSVCQYLAFAKRDNTSSKYYGVTMKRNAKPWVAVANKTLGHKTIGYYNTEDEAARAFDKFVVELHGAEAKVNFPDEWPGHEKATKNYRNSSSKLVGVTFINQPKRKWLTLITVDGKICYFGRSFTEEEAARIYDYHALKLYGKHAKLNFPTGE